MDYRTYRLVSLMLQDCRITTKQLGSSLRTTQQNASYQIRQLERKGIILNYQTIADPAKFGLITLQVLYNYARLDATIMDTVQHALCHQSNVTFVEHLSDGADLLVQYSVPNLSHFNKIHTDLMHELQGSLYINRISTFIVKHIYSHDYLSRSARTRSMVLGGDRDMLVLKDRQRKVLAFLMKDARMPIIKIADEIGVDSKTVLGIKKWLEKNKIVRKYTANISQEKLGIDRQYLFLKLGYSTPDELMRLTQYARDHANIVELSKILGEYDVMIVVEKLNPSLRILQDIRKDFEVINYQVLSSQGILKNVYLPADVLE